MKDHQGEADSSKTLSSSRLPGRQAQRIYQALAKAYPQTHCTLNHCNAFELLVATILSAQCTDQRVNLVTPALFARWPGPEALAKADRADIEQVIRSTGFFRNKAQSIQGAASMIVERFGSQVPRTMEELLMLPGVARKTANVVLGVAYGISEGVVVDTHVQRLSRRLGLTRADNPVHIERDLMALFKKSQWSQLAHLFIAHGRKICGARKLRCPGCPLEKLCPKLGVEAQGV